jgi:hypothetical protein
MVTNVSESKRKLNKPKRKLTSGSIEAAAATTAKEHSAKATASMSATGRCCVNDMSQANQKSTFKFFPGKSSATRAICDRPKSR